MANFPTITESGTNRLPASFSDVYVKPSGEKWQTLGGIMDASWELADYAKDDSRGRNKSNNASGFTATFKMKQATVTELELLDTLQNGANDFLFKGLDAAAIPTGGAAATVGWVTVTSAQCDAKARGEYSGDASNNAFIEVTIKGTVLNSGKDACVKASIDDDEFESSADAGAFHAIGTYTAAKDGGTPKNANFKPCGVTNVTLAYTGGAAQTLTMINDFKMTFDFVGKPDSKGRQGVSSVNFLCEFDYTQTDAATLLTLDSWVDNDIDVVVTTLAAVVFTFSNQLGIDTKILAGTNISDPRVIHVICKGSVAKATFDSIVS